ncbi:UPF0758 domain-containing protein [Shigella flexneri]
MRGNKGDCHGERLLRGDMPREKMQKSGIGALSDDELLALFYAQGRMEKVC